MDAEMRQLLCDLLSWREAPAPADPLAELIERTRRLAGDACVAAALIEAVENHLEKTG